MDRRRFLTLTGLATTAGLAGCSSGGNDGGADENGGGNGDGDGDGSGSDDGNGDESNGGNGDGSSNGDDGTSSDGGNSDGSDGGNGNGSDGGNSDGSGIDSVTQGDTSGIEILNHEMQITESSPDDEITITGTVENNSGETQQYIEVVALVYDEDGNQIAHEFSNIENFENGSTWDFEILFFADGDAIDDYEIGVSNP